MLEMLRQRARESEGATAVEYGIMVALIAVVIIGAVVALGGTLEGVFEDTEECIDTEGDTCPGDDA